VGPPRQPIQERPSVKNGIRTPPPHWRPSKLPGNHGISKKNGPGFRPRNWADDAANGRSRCTGKARESQFSGRDFGSENGLESRPTFFQKTTERTEKISSAATARIVAPMLWEVGSTLHAPCSRGQLRRHRARPLPGLAPTIPRGAGGPCESSPSACRRCQLHAGSVRP
jgi:hypothetical protein